MTALSDLDQRNFLKNILSIPALSGEESARADFIQTNLEKIFTTKIDRIGNNLILRLGNQSATRQLLLCSHIDTVAPADGWTKNPYQATDSNDCIYGLGANDALASGVCMVAALSHMQTPLNSGVTLAWVAEEEKGSNGFCAIEPELKYTDAIFGEPTDMRVGTAMRGYMRLKIIGQGIACHASRPWEGKNAIFDLMHQLTKIETLPLKDSSPWGQATVQPTQINAGKSVNQIPDTAEAYLDIRPTAEINNAKIIDLLNQAGCNFEILFNRRKPMTVSPTSDVMRAIITACPAHVTYGFGGSCDMAFATSPSVIMGPGKSDRSHAADEYITYAELSDATTQYTAILNAYDALESKENV